MWFLKEPISLYILSHEEFSIIILIFHVSDLNGGLEKKILLKNGRRLSFLFYLFVYIVVFFYKSRKAVGTKIYETENKNREIFIFMKWYFKKNI